MPMHIAPTDSRLAWPGVVSLHPNGDWVMPWRVPYEERGLFPGPLVERAAMPAGVRLAFRTDATSVAGRCVAAPESAPIDLCCDGALIGTAPLAGNDGFRFEGLPAGEKLIELWLPQFGEFRLRSLELSDGATLRPFQDERPRWITYGSSITQCRAAASPAQTWPAIVARERGLRLTCLGYGGQCHLDSMVARMMRDLPADFLSMCVGINIYGGATLNPRTFRPAIIGFVQLVRETHPDTPFVVMSPIVSPPRESTLNPVGFTLAAMREEVAAAVEALRAHGDRHVHYLDGLQVFGPELAHLLPDHVHPNAEGYRVMGRNFLRAVAELFVGDK
ncbi:MAG: GDSL-type esterase/lipase family protein [Chloroflexota bacterium]